MVYKIKRKSDGKFSTGGHTPKFTKIGKLWREKGPLKNHLNHLKRFHHQLELYGPYSDFSNFEIIVLSTIEVETLTINKFYGV